jgi:hypothetical protein
MLRCCSTTIPRLCDTDIFWTVGYQSGSTRSVDANGEVAVSTAKTQIQRSTDDGDNWSLISSPNPNPTPTGTGTNVLEAVTSLNADNAWAVGYSRDNSGGAVQPLIEKWDGIHSQWNIVTSFGSLPSGDNYLYGVDVVNSTDIWAEGYTTTTSGNTILFLHWDGTEWDFVASDAPGLSSFGFGIECLSKSKCWGVGTYKPEGPYNFQTLTERWNGTGWSRVSSPNGSGPNVLYGVWSVNAEWTWTVGRFGTPWNTLIEKWDGTQWSIVSSPSPGGSYSELRSVTVVPGTSPTAGGDSWAVGNYYDSTNHVNKTLIERYTIAPVCCR